MNKVRGRFPVWLAMAGVLGVSIAVAIAGIAGAEKPVHTTVGKLELTFNGGFTPKALSRTKLTPITFNISGDIKTKDGSHPPALKEFILETDKNGVINVKGVPTCTAGVLESTDTRHAELACPNAIIGTGHATAQIAFVEQPPVNANSKIIAFNGGVRGGVTTLYIHAYITVPAPSAIVSTVKIERIHKGRYGLLSVTTIPKIAAGSGSVTHFDLTIDRHGVLLAKCTDGKLVARGSAIFSDGTKASAGVVRPCTPKG
jgi:hypothetical protein